MEVLKARTWEHDLLLLVLVSSFHSFLFSFCGYILHSCSTLELLAWVIGCADGVNTFQGKRTGVVQQFKMNYSPRILGIHCMVRIGLFVLIVVLVAHI